MARAKDQPNGRLEEALNMLIQSQAALLPQQTAFLARAAETDHRLSELDRIIAERLARIDERFARIDERFARIEAILMEHGRILQALPEAIREKIGFKIPGQAGASS
jgi:hypothetical protein